MNNRGQSLLEVIVVSAVGVLIAGALVFATISSLRNANLAKSQAQVTKLSQEGIERLRASRDRNGEVYFSPLNRPLWADDSLWNSQIASYCANPCYFNISGSNLTNIGAGGPIPSSAELVGQFNRVVILSDETSRYQVEKIATVVVVWTDFAGKHESRLTTILRRL